MQAGRLLPSGCCRQRKSETLLNFGKGTLGIEVAGATSGDQKILSGLPLGTLPSCLTSGVAESLVMPTA